MTSGRIPVLQLVDGFATDGQSGGASLFGIQLARHLDRERYAPFVCGLWGYGTPSEQRWRAQLYNEGIGTTILIERPSRLAPDLLHASALLAILLDRVQPQIINSHFERGDLLALWSKVTHRSHPRIVRTMHTDQQWQKRPWLGHVLNFAALPWIFDAEVAISQAAKQGMDARLGARLAGCRSIVLYNGISRSQIERLLAARNTRSPLTSRTPRITIVGRLEEQKGHRFFLGAGAKVLRQLPEAELWVVGTGNLREQLQEQAHALGIEGSTRFWGQRNDVERLLLESDLLVSSSVWEGFPTVILEAMAAGVPVVATDIPGTRELVQHDLTGLLVAPQQSEALANAILTLLGDRDQAERLADRAAHTIYQYTLEHTADGYNALYRSLIKP